MRLPAAKYCWSFIALVALATKMYLYEQRLSEMLFAELQLNAISGLSAIVIKEYCIFFVLLCFISQNYYT